MRIKKDEKRIGNFIVAHRNGFIRIRDINGMVTHSVKTEIAKGSLLQAAYEEGGDFLPNYCAVMFNVMCAIPDNEFLKDLNEAAIKCVNRHKDVYGIKEDIPYEEDSKILMEERELNEVENDIRKDYEEGNLQEG